MPARLHIAVLECDTPVPAVTVSHGSYGDCMERLLDRGVGQVGELAQGLTTTPMISKWDVVGATKYPAVDEIDAILLTGSKHNAFDNDDWILRLVAFVQTVIRAGKRVGGICFGHQIVSRVLGANVSRGSGWEVAACNVQLTEAGRQLFGDKQSLILHQMHRDIVESVPAGCELLGRSETCEVQGLHKPKSILTIQAHPEFDGEILRHIIALRASQNIFAEDFAQDALKRAEQAHDGDIVGTAFAKFLFDL